MTQEHIFTEREESLSNLWLFIVINTTVLALLINILSLHYGQNDVAPNLFYIPVVIAAYWYPHRGPVFAVIISLAYMALVYLFLGSDIAMLIASSVICYVMIGVSVVVSSLATHMRRNEVKYRSLFNHSQAGVGLVNLTSLRIKEANNRFASILGYTGQEILQISFGDLFLEPEKIEFFFRQLDHEKDIENFETRFRSRSGESRWMLISAGMMPENQFVVTLVDITDRRQAQELLMIKDHAIRSSINAVAILDLDLTFTYVNPMLTRMLEYYDEKEFIGKNLGTFMMAKPAFTEIQNTLSEAGSWFGEVVLLKQNRKRFDVFLWANPVKDENGKPVWVMISFIDISEKKQIEIAKRKALGQIEQNIEQFAILGDQIRNPLAVIMGLSSLAPGDITDRIIHQVREIDRIITKLDKGWIESEKVRDFIKKYYMVGTQEEEADASDLKKEESRPGSGDMFR